MIKIRVTLCVCSFCCLVKREERNGWLDVVRTDEVRSILLVLAGKYEGNAPLENNSSRLKSIYKVNAQQS